MKTITSKIRGLVSILLVVCIFASLPLTTFATEGKAAYIITYHVGAYDVFTDVEGNMSVTIDGVKYYYSDDYGRYDDISDNFHSMKNTNVLYELQNNEIVRVYSLDNVLVPSVKAEPSVKEGLFYKNGKFSQTNFDLTIKVTNQLNNTFQGKNLLNYLSTTEKNRLYTTLKKLEIEPSGQVDFGSSGWWLWKDYKTNIAENYNDDIKVNETKEYRYTVNLRNNKALNQSEYNIEFYTKPTFDFGTLNRITSKVKVGNLDYQEEKTETKKAKSNAGKTASEATTKLEGLKTAIQFSNNILTSEQQKEVNEEVNLWISQLILARNVDKSDLSGKISQDIAKKWLSKLGVDSGVLLSPGVIKATHYLKTKTSGGTEIFIEFNINITSFTFGNSGLPTMASGSGSATIYDMNGQKLDSSTILPAYADVCAFCKQLQAVAKSSILDITKQYRSIFGVDSDATAEALSSEIMGKILNSKYTKNVFKRISARDVKAVLKKIISDGDKKCTDKIFELLTTPSKNSTLISVKCPVDVTVYDNDGKICGMVKNNVVDTSYNDVFINVVGDQKNIYLIGDDYTFTMTGTDSGKMDYVVKEFDEQGNTTGTITYENIRLTNDCKYYSYVPEAINHDSVLFNLTDNKGNVVSDTTSINFDEVEESGKCGQDVYWAMNNDGTLYIYGEGDIYIYPCSPWYSYKESIKTVKISNGITSIDWHAFYDCANLTSITIPDSVTRIGYKAFSNCEKLTDITIPDSVTRILEGAFYDCASLTSITIPDSITSIENSAFENCTSLTSITIPDSVTSIGDWTFENCTSLTSITIPDSVASIGIRAFSDCTSLTSITIPDSVTSIGAYAFDYPRVYSLERSIYINSLKKWCEIDFENYYSNPMSRGSELYLNNFLIKEIKIPNNITNINDYTFCGCTSLTSVTIPDSVASIGKGAFSDCTSLTSIAIPDSVTSIGQSAFGGCAGLTSITIPDSVTSIEWGAFSDCESLTSITIPDSITSIEAYTFDCCRRLTSITIPNSVKKIGYSAFRYCENLTDITIPDSVTSIEWGAFQYCEKLTSISIPESVTSIEFETFIDCRSLKYITIPSSVTSIGKGAFNCCTSLTNITIPDSVISIGDDAFYYCTSLTGITIPDSVTSIGENAFYHCYSLKSIIIPDSVTNIGESAFKGCENLTIYGYKNTAAEEYALNNGFEFINLAEERTLTDKATSISVSGVVNSNADLNVSKLENTYEKSVATYDITLQKDGIAIQPDGAITIKIPSDVKDCKVMWLKDDGTAEDMNAEYIDGCYVFTTDHLSVYALVQDKTILKGDANQDGVVNIIDATYLQKHIVGYKNSDDSVLIDETNRQLFDTIDMNKDGKLTIVDATDLQMYILENN